MVLSSNTSVNDMKKIAKMLGIKKSDKMNREKLLEALKGYVDPHCKAYKDDLFHHERSGKSITTKLVHCSYLPLRSIKHLAGPLSFAKYVYGNKTFYIFGENHTTPDICRQNFLDTVYFDGLLNSLVTTKPEQNFDLFIETAVRDRHRKLNVQYASKIISLVERTFGDCIKETKECPFKNLRIHSVDYRSFLLLLYKIDRSDIYFNPSKITDERKNVITDVLKKLMSSPKMLKQFDNINDRDFATGLYEMFSNSMDLPATLSYKTSLVMDAYATARMFRDFKNIKNGVRAGESNTILYYAGLAHARTLVKVMKNIGATEVYQSDIKNNISCIDFDAEKIFS